MHWRRLTNPSTAAVALGLDDTESGRRRIRLVVLVAAAIGAAAFVPHALFAPTRTAYATERVRNGDLVVDVTATGTLLPTEQVDVGSELSGTIRSVDVDYNDQVRAGQV